MQDDEMRRRFYEEAVATAANAVLARRHNAALRVNNRFRDDRWYYNQYYYYHPYDLQDEKFDGLIPWFFRMVRLFFIGLLLLCSSTVVYGVFYVAIMPGDSISRPLFFDYTGTVAFPHRNMTLVPLGNIPSEAGSSSQESPPMDTQQPPYTHAQTAPEAPAMSAYTPWATVDLFSKEQAVMLWGDTTHAELVPPTQVQERLLNPQQAYFVEVALVLPESEINRLKGMFGVAVDLLSHPNDNNNSTVLKLASSVRSARLPYESTWVGVVRKILWLIPLIAGVTEETRTLTVSSFRHIVESPEYPLRHVVVLLLGQTLYSRSPIRQSQSQQQHHYQHQNYHSSARYRSQQQTQQHPPNSRQYQDQQQLLRPIEVVGGEIRIGKELNRFQSLLRERFCLCYFVGTLILFGIHVLAWSVLHLYLDGESKVNGDDYMEAPYCDMGDDEFFVAEGHDNTHSDNNEHDPHEDEGPFAGTRNGHRAFSGDEYQGHSFAEGGDDRNDWEECNSVGVTENMDGNTTTPIAHQEEPTRSSRPPRTPRPSSPTRQHGSAAWRQPNHEWVKNRRRLPVSGDLIDRPDIGSHPEPLFGARSANNQRFDQEPSSALSSTNGPEASCRRSAKSRTTENRKLNAMHLPADYERVPFEATFKDQAITKSSLYKQSRQRGAPPSLDDSHGDGSSSTRRDEPRVSVAEFIGDDEAEPFFDAFDDAAPAPDDQTQVDAQNCLDNSGAMHLKDAVIAQNTSTMRACVDNNDGTDVEAGQVRTQIKQNCEELQPPAIAQDFNESIATLKPRNNGNHSMSRTSILMKRGDSSPGEALDDEPVENPSSSCWPNNAAADGDSSGYDEGHGKHKQEAISPLLEWAVSFAGRRWGNGSKDRNSRDSRIEMDQDLVATGQDHANEHTGIDGTIASQPVPIVGAVDHDSRSELLLSSRKHELKRSIILPAADYQHENGSEMLSFLAQDLDAAEVMCSPDLPADPHDSGRESLASSALAQVNDSEVVCLYEVMNHSLLHDDHDSDSVGSWELIPVPGQLQTTELRRTDEDCCSGDSVESYLRTPEGQVFGSLVNDLIGPFVGLFSSRENVGST